MTEPFKLNEEDQEILDDYRKLKAEEEALKAKKAELEPYVIEIMEEFDIKNIEQGDLKVTYVPGSTSMQFDSTKFKKENPKIVEQYQKESNKKAHIRAKLKE